MSIDMMLQKWAIFIMGVDGEILSRIQHKFRVWLYNKRWHTSWKFQLEIRSNKKVIAKKPLTNLYEMNSSFSYMTTCILNISKIFSKKNLQPRARWAFQGHDPLFPIKMCKKLLFPSKLVLVYNLNVKQCGYQMSNNKLPKFPTFKVLGAANFSRWPFCTSVHTMG